MAWLACGVSRDPDEAAATDLAEADSGSTDQGSTDQGSIDDTPTDLDGSELGDLAVPGPENPIFASPTGADACEILGAAPPERASAAALSPDTGFVDVTERLGLTDINCAVAAVADLNGDGSEDLFLPCNDIGVAGIYFQCGGGRFISFPLRRRLSRPIGWGASPTAAGVSDANDDGLIDLTIAYGDRVIWLENVGGLRFEVHQIWYDPVRSRITGLVPLPNEAGVDSHLYITRLGTGSHQPEELVEAAANLVGEFSGGDWTFARHEGDGLVASLSATFGAGLYSTVVGNLLVVVNDGGGPIAPFEWTAGRLSVAATIPPRFDNATGMGLSSIPLNPTRSIREERRLMFAEAGSVSSWAITAAGIADASSDLQLVAPETQLYWGGACTYVDADAYPDCFVAAGVGGTSPELRQEYATSNGPFIEPDVQPHYLRGARSGDRIVLVEVDAGPPFDLGQADTYGTTLIRQTGTHCDLLVLPSHPQQLGTPLRVFQTPCVLEGGRRLSFDVSGLRHWAVEVYLDNGEVVSVDADATYGVGVMHKRSFATVALGEAEPTRAVVHAAPDLLLEINDGLVPGSDIRVDL